MRRLLVLSLTVTILSLTASAQYNPRNDPRYGDPRYGNQRYSDRGDYGRGDYGRGGDILGQVRADLDRAESVSRPNGGDRHRFDKVREEINEFQRYGRKGELNDTISALQKVVSRNRLDYQARDVLNQDLYQLREFRAQNGWR